LAPSTSLDGVLVEAPDFSADMSILTRDFARNDLSPLPISVGRKLAKMSFTVELRSNNKTTGLNVDAPVIARLFQACGYSLNANAAAWASPVYDTGDEANPVTFVTGGSQTNTDLIAYYVTVSLAGVSATARFTITSDTAGEGSGPTAVTSGASFTVGTKGLTITPTFTGSLVLGQQWVVWALPIANSLAPLSASFPSLSLAMYLDGVQHTISGALGTFSIDAQAGQYAKAKFEFTGQYIAPTDVALVNPAFERALPAQVQLARLNIANYSAIVNAFTYTQGNTIVPRPDMNGTDGYNGVRITGRKPEGGIDPEATLVATHDFWGRMSASTRMPFQWRAGNVAGNTVWFLAPNTQYMKMTYKDRSGLRVYDAGLAFSRINGDDEVLMLFA